MVAPFSSAVQTYVLAISFLPADFYVKGVASNPMGTPVKAFASIISGAIGGLIIGLITEYYTSHR